MTQTPTDRPLEGRRVLVTGATGYIGGLLVPRLLVAGAQVRVLVRDQAKLRRRAWREDVEVAQGDATSAEDLRAALTGVDVAYYLLHSMDGKGDFVERDAALAETFAAAATEVGISRVIYLSGLHPEGDLSAHLGSRVQVGEILLDSAVPAAVIQAGVVIGDGSASFDMLRHLAERLPAMVAPRWLRNRIQPIAVDDVLHYLVAAASLPAEVNREIDVGGADVLTYSEMLREYARIAGLAPRLIRTVPVLTPRLASGWVGVVTPVGSGVARPLVGSLVHEAVVRRDDADELLGAPDGGRLGYETAVRRALRTVDAGRWRRTLTGVGAAVAATAVAGSVLTDPTSRWYTSLRTPPWQPPGWVIPVVWNAIYAATTVAATATLAELGEEAEREGEPGERARAQRRDFRRALAVNLVGNAAWCGLFFRGHRLGASALGSLALGVSAADLARRSAPLGRLRVGAFAGYAAWCTFAAALSGELWRRNR